MNYEAFMAESRRLALLRVLTEASGYKANESILQIALDHLGHHVSRDQVRGDLAWLKEAALLTVEDVSGIHVATLTKRGRDVAEGRAEHPGVQRPAPGGC